MASDGTAQALELQAILNSAALKPPEGVVSDFDNRSNGNRMVMIVVGVCMGIATLCGAIRTYAKVVCTKKVRKEDYLGLVAFAFHIGATATMVLLYQGLGLYVHQWNVRVRELEGFLQVTIYLSAYISYQLLPSDIRFPSAHSLTVRQDYITISVMYCIVLTFIKISILLEWTRIFVPRAKHNTFYWVCHATIWANTGLYIAAVVLLNLACVPREKIWHRWIPGTCLDIGKANMAIASFDLVFNLLILLLPHMIIWSLYLSMRQKIAVSVIFSVGMITCACSAGRVHSSYTLLHLSDDTYNYSAHLLWGIAELTTAEMVFCIPTFPIAYRGIRPYLPLWLLDCLGRTKKHMIPSRRGANRAIPGGGDLSKYARMREASEVHLNTLTPAKLTRVKSKHARPLPTPGLGGILCTTEIEVEVITEESPSFPVQHPGQHTATPWVKHDKGEQYPPSFM
ncbi:hypothetical protein F4778DRAFT_138639 [Xylariomycetidae sp. FL2044]|nr:hypothetical protein F4778DRAFT_138639 [Xylariomycetidae sp. FL2044]